ncbi:MAG TPA: hypothetical protein RMH85_22820 [Polyangiaceae bacterium LLY-WYZ-15_(1-7)]|nr:hypothetical protein [Myxococcales bacterium]MAT27545.1 hypothetical protein [Sandaracinus sp.]HJK92334.1 hypothetical protein [Polyangiaceae bacterium LLY-WYZ-15_(1-7)]MBJ74143.1 hypothetical protein [Sandaracinus sp.]HJL06397.1 hypothetical protein [Polyangiaceae bacterium LLY-WYZ-15_(1-7)]
MGLVACGDGDGGAVDAGDGDAGVAMMDDASTPPSDGGMPGEDAATPDEDGGLADGGAEPDASTCPRGYAGEDCMECAEGWVEGMDRECIPGCDATGEDAFECGPGSECLLSPADGLRYCVCLDGYEGEMCDTCSEGFERVGSTCRLISPPALGLALWLDGDAMDSIDVDSEMRLTDWRDRRGLGGIVATPTTGIARPLYRPEGRNGRGAVDFDGENDQLIVNGFTGLSSTDIEVVVAGEFRGELPAGIFGALTGTSAWAFMIERSADRDFRVLFRNPPGTSGGVETVVERDAPAGPMYVAATHMASSSNDTLAIFAADGADESSGLHLFGAPSSPLPSPLNLRIGRTQNGRLLGRVYEVLVYSRRLSVSERAEVATYLRAKWNLP